MVKKNYNGSVQAYEITEKSIEKVFDTVMREEYKKGNILFTEKSDKPLYLEMAREVNFEVLSYIFESDNIYEICKNKVREVSDFYNDKFNKNQNVII